MKDLLREIGSLTLRELEKQGVREAIVIVRANNEVMIKLANSQPSVIQNWNRVKLSVRMAKDKKVLITEAEVSGKESLGEFIRKVISGIDRLRESELYAPVLDELKVKPLGKTVDKRVIDYMGNPDRIIDLVFDEINKYSVEKVAGTVDLIYSEKLLMTSKGGELYEDSTGVMVYLRSFKGDNTGHWAWSSKFMNEDELRLVARKSAEYASLNLPQIKFEPGKYDVILSPLVVGNIFGYVSYMASAFAVMSGFSMFMKNKSGDKVGSDVCTIIDDPRMESMYGSTAFDDEGVETFTKPIIENGYLRTFLHNIATALKMKAKTTGNAGWVTPSPWNIIIPPGTIKEDELVKEVKHGILIINNWYTRLQNWIEGIFSTVSRDVTVLIENGEFKGFVGRVRIADNLSRVLKNLHALCNKQYSIKWWEVEIPTLAPYVLVKDMNVTKPFE